MRRPVGLRKRRAFEFEGRRWIISKVDRVSEIVDIQSFTPDGRLEIRTATWTHASQLLGLTKGNTR